MGKFIWADLSSYTPDKSIAFYKNVFGWSIENLNEYYLCYLEDKAVAGIFETPAPLKKIAMPHFWMSYFQVNNTEKTVALAKELNAKVEVNPTEFYNGHIALIRDPQGAGFTIYDGQDLSFSTLSKHGVISKTELHVSNVKNVLSFYSALFDWKIIEGKYKNEYVVASQNNDSNIVIKRFENKLKGKYEYWVTTILVDNLVTTAQRAIENGGSIISKEEQRILIADNSEEAFFYIEEKA